jgi:hypothetical protein
MAMWSQLVGGHRQQRRPAHSVLISITHSYLNLREPATGLRFDDVGKLEAQDESGNPLVPFDQDVLPPASIGVLATFESGYRQGLGPRGKGTRFFLFAAGAVHACEGVEFQFHTTARPTLGKRYFLAAHRKHVNKSPETDRKPRTVCCLHWQE